MPCKNCTCDECYRYYNTFCPDCGHHIKFHGLKRCNQPTCKCKMRPFIKWRKVEEEINSPNKSEGLTPCQDVKLVTQQVQTGSDNHNQVKELLNKDYALDGEQVLTQSKQDVNKEKNT